MPGVWGSWTQTQARRHLTMLCSSRGPPWGGRDIEWQAMFARALAGGWGVGDTHMSFDKKKVFENIF